jgi:hypothetical protein
MKGLLAVSPYINCLFDSCAKGVAEAVATIALSELNKLANEPYITAWPSRPTCRCPARPCKRRTQRKVSLLLIHLDSLLQKSIVAMFRSLAVKGQCYKYSVTYSIPFFPHIRYYKTYAYYLGADSAVTPACTHIGWQEVYILRTILNEIGAASPWDRQRKGSGLLP